MAMLLPLDIVLEMWLFQEPQWELPDQPGTEPNSDNPAGAVRPLDVAAASALATIAGGLDPDAVFTGYCIVPKCFWHFEDNAFSLPWHGVRDEDDPDRLHELQQRKAPAGAQPHAPERAGEPGGDAD
jgi:hypothetical protein